VPNNYSYHTIFLKREEITTRTKTFLKNQPIRKDETKKTDIINILQQKPWLWT